MVGSAFKISCTKSVIGHQSNDIIVFQYGDIVLFPKGCIKKLAHQMLEESLEYLYLYPDVVI